MPYSFIDIEKEKTWLIGVFFVILIGFYFVTAVAIVLVTKSIFLFSASFESGSAAFHFPITPSLTEILATVAIAFIAGTAHWLISTNQIIDRILASLSAESLNTKDTYHNIFHNVVDEVSVAIGGQPIECAVLPVSGMNAFALQDLSGRAVIGVTEGLLAKLNRAQLEAVVGHEAAHIASGDCVMTTISSSLFDLYATILQKINVLLSRTRQAKGSIYLVVIYLIVSLSQAMSYVLRFFISRQREYRSDAIAVRLSRDPLSLAQALYAIGRSWRGAGLPAEKLSSIFIVSPRYNYYDESEGFFSNFFSTHPPIKHRIAILIDMAHTNVRSIEEEFKKKKIKTEQQPVPITVDDPQWLVHCDGSWNGPFAADAIRVLKGFSPHSWIRRVGTDTITPAYADGDLNGIFCSSMTSREIVQRYSCPQCRLPLTEILYEGTPIHQCMFCQGILADRSSVNKVLMREDMDFSDVVKKDGDFILAHMDSFNFAKKYKIDSALLWECPRCHQPMLRHFYNLTYPIEVDKCLSCNLVWFDKNELELLQYVSEKARQAPA